MKRDEVFDPSLKSAPPPANLVLRSAIRADRDAITRLMAERNPDQPLAEVLKKTDRELDTIESESNYRLFIADQDGEVVGLCRYYHSAGLPEAKKIYPSPEGWYGMGILVDHEMRRQGIARFLFSHRLDSLRSHGATELYSVVDSTNLTSIRMHREFGFEEISQAPGFLHIKFESGCGSLFRRLV